MTKIQQRCNEIKQHYNDINALEDIYTKLTYDIAIETDNIVKAFSNSRNKKLELNSQELKSVAEFNRAYEMSEEYIIERSIRYTIEAINHLKSGVYTRVMSLKNTNY